MAQPIKWQATDEMAGVRFRQGTRGFISSSRPDWLWSPTCLYPVGTGMNWSERETHHFHLIPKLRMFGLLTFSLHHS
jgi:hypothetical protein